MSFIGGVPTISELDLYTSMTTAPSGLQLGDLLFGPQGKAFRLGLVGGSTLVVGNMLQSPARDTQFDDMAVPAAVAINSPAGFPVVITNGTTVVAAGDFVGGTVEVSVTPDLGSEYTIIDHSTAANGAALTLYLDRPIRVAWSTSTKVTLRKNPYRGLIQSPATTLTGTPAGAAIYAAANATYTFVQTLGVGAALSDGTSILVGSPVAVPSGTAGAVILGAGGLATVGNAMRAAASGKTIPVDFKIC